MHSGHGLVEVFPDEHDEDEENDPAAENEGLIEKTQSSQAQDSFDSIRTVHHKESFKAKRWLIMVLLCTAATLSPLTSNAYLPAMKEIQHDLNTTRTLVTWTLFSYASGMALLPILWGSISDKYSRKYVLAGTVALFAAASLACGFSADIIMLIAFRGLQAAGASSVICVGAVSIADIIPKSETGDFLGIFGAVPSLLTVIAPAIGAFVGLWNWRGIFFGLAALGFLQSIFLFAFLPETLPKRDRTRVIWKSNNPMSSLKVLVSSFEVGILALATCLNYAGPSLTTVVFSLHVRELHDISGLIHGILYVPLGLGYVFGSYVGGKSCAWIVKLWPNVGQLGLIAAGLYAFALGIVGFGLTVHDHLYIATAFTFLISFTVNFVQPPLICYSIFLQPKHPSATVALYQLTVFPLTAVVYTIGNLLLDKFGIVVCFAFTGGLIVVVTVPLVVLIIKRSKPTSGSNKSFQRH